MYHSFLNPVPNFNLPVCRSALSTSSSDCPTVILDTNVVLDWLVFGNAGCRPLAHAIESKQVRWISTDAMRLELDHVIHGSALHAWQPDTTAIWQAWRRLCEQVKAPTPSLIKPLRCTDPDDQIFVDLALQSRGALISRDRAVLKLARRAAHHGVRILLPEAWSISIPAMKS